MNTKTLVFVCLLALLVNLACATTSVFVSDANGSDASGDGSMASPFKTISKAQAYVRTLDKSSGDGIFVEIRGGSYYLSESLMFDEQDSGTASTPITYRAYDGEEVIIIGGVTIGGWSPVTDPVILDRLKAGAQSHVLVASLGSLDMGTLVRRGFYVPGGYAAMELFFKNDPMSLSRYPNDDFMLTEDLNDLTFSFTPPDDNLALWMQETDPHAMGYWQFDWADEYAALLNIQGGNGQVTATLGATPIFGIANGHRFYLLNFLCELDAPGEYYIDRDNANIYFWPPVTDFDQSDVVVSILDYVFHLDGTSYLNFEGLTIEASRKEGIYGVEIQNVTLKGLTIRNTGTTSVTATISSNVLIDRCLIENSGDAAVILQGGDRQTLTRSNIVARNNVVRNFSRWSKTYTPAFKVDGVGVTIEHNEIYNGPHTALWWSLETQDVGAFYAGRDWTYRGNVIKYNFFHDIKGYNDAGAVGVYLDDQYSSAEVFGNIFYDLTTAVLIGGGRNNHIKNNIFIQSTTGIYFDGRGIGACGPPSNATLYASLDSVPYTQEPWASAFPELASILDGNPNNPVNDVMGTNIFVGCITDIFLCTLEFLEPYLEQLDDCTLTLDDFADALALNFTLKDGVLEQKCTSTDFLNAFEQIPFDKIGVIPLPQAPVSAPLSNSPASAPQSAPSGNGPSPQTVSTASTARVFSACLFVLLLF